MAYKTFANGYPLTASELNNYLMNQSVISFASSAARASAITSPVEGMLTYLEDTNVYEGWNGSAWTDINDNTSAIPKSTVTTAGDLILGTGASTVGRLGIGTSGQVLTSNGTTASWVKVPPITTQGDIVVGNASGVADRLAIGTNGQVLQSNGTTASWATPAGGGGITLLGTQTLNGSATYSFTSIDQGYKSIRLIVVGLKAASNHYPYFGVSGNYHTFSGVEGEGSTGSFTAKQSNGVQFDPVGTLANNALNFVLLEYENYSSTTQYKGMRYFGSYTSTSSNRHSFNLAGAWESTSAITQVNVGSTQTFTGGTAYLYGVK